MYIFSEYSIKISYKFSFKGLSAGTGLVSRTFGEDFNPFTAGVGISPGIGIEKSVGRPEPPYNQFVLFSMKNFLKRNETILKDVVGYRECMNAKNPQEFLDNSYAMAGYSSTAEYYENECGLRTMTKVQISIDVRILPKISLIYSNIDSII